MTAPERTPAPSLKPTPTPTSESDCSDGVDEDEDGLTDCADDDCAGEKVCAEDCTDGIDNNLDGLLDCEDNGCVDACVEDCSNGTDEDQDGLKDCDDDECYGIDGCAGPYNLASVVSVERLAWGAGPDWSVRGDYSYNFASVAYGTVQLTGSPDGWSGADMTCSGDIDGGLDTPLPDLMSDIGEYVGVEYAMDLSPASRRGR